MVMATRGDDAPDFPGEIIEFPGDDSAGVQY